MLIKTRFKTDKEVTSNTTCNSSNYHIHTKYKSIIISQNHCSETIYNIIYIYIYIYIYIIYPLQDRCHEFVTSKKKKVTSNSWIRTRVTQMQDQHSTH